jgi:hypothetical protein
MNTFTYNILLATASPDDVVEKGEIKKEGALSILKSFPFQEELAKREQNPDLMAPTLTFHNNSTGQDLAIWSEASDDYTVWKPDAMANADGVKKEQALLTCVSLFFDEKDEELNEFVETLTDESTQQSTGE